ncbi:PAS domain S-box protein [Paenibacillus larvae]|uniref:histidine kinase n=6 Tax=Paenibacillus larvae TaxID=1464 RepID=V9W4D5_9BACL|nr:PAS domain S-box protein [Paenibacillus larvae]AHD04495.1 sporulation kinase [Paenibacillus larvae subsp. larvae DSM 25430]AQR79295.1 PAS domain-containing sensor histidine kinase [Paenibacillus larvae subsp. larvae]AQT85640.1 PAS domain-containing sensor histidine kinase [Paenibacillus larvae subsp. pulvifaciens]ARF69017.1 PAS domain-containing sensor histidine kinase [Paenibacillus larvae subsp. pulvifaciens]AVF23540.1 sporulation kinase [Paenibacillus larvae subsp. larvae]
MTHFRSHHPWEYHEYGKYRGLDQDSRREESHGKLDELFKQSFDQAATGFAVLTPQGKYLIVNQTLCEMLGYSESELLTSYFQMFSYPDDLHQDLIYLKEMLEGKRTCYQMEKRCVHKSGSLLWVLLSVSVIRDGQGKPQYLVSQMQDITAGKKMEKQLLDEQKRYLALLEYIPDMICFLDYTGRLCDVNPAAVKLTGYSEEELTSNFFLRFIVPEEWDRVWNLLEEAKGYRVSEGEIHIMHKEGHRLIMEARAIPIHFEGQQEGVYLIARDVTERKKTEELFRKSEKLTVIGQIAAGVAHEIRNPLTTLKGFIQLFHAGEEGKQEYYEVMMGELNRIELIITEMLVLAKPHMSHFQPRHIDKIIQNVLILLDTEAKHKNIRIVVAGEADLAPVLCEENQLKQLFIHLLKNAVESMEHGGKILIQIRGHGKDRICVRITDQGCGIAPEQMHKLGEPFYTTKEKGTGLGMMISYKIIEDHQGTMEIESKMGEGTTVSVYLPIMTE